MSTGGNPGTVLASASCRMLTLSSRTKTDTGRRTRAGMLTPYDASPLPRAQKERRGTAIHLRWVRLRIFSWGATPEELERPMAGDDACPRPQLNATRAVTFAARPGEVWPWLVQWGWNRAGFYSYDLLDNLGRRSA
jgi:hypothetical protein